MESTKRTTAEKIITAVSKFGKLSKIICNGRDVTSAVKILFGSVENWLNNIKCKFCFAISRVNGVVTLSVATEAAK